MRPYPEPDAHRPSSLRRQERRWPIIAFNAGLVGLVGLADECKSMRQPVLVLRGESSGKPMSGGYADGLPRCMVEVVPGARNVLPWEATPATVSAIDRFVRDELHV